MSSEEQKNMAKKSISSPLNFIDSTDREHRGDSVFILKNRSGFVTSSLFLIIILLIASVLVCGCNDVETTQVQPAQAESNIMITTKSALVTDHIGDLPPPGEDYVFLIVPITIENPKGGVPVLIDDTHLRLSTKGAGGYDVILKADIDDWYRSYEGFLFENEISPIEYGVLQPGESTSGDVLFIAFKDRAEPVGISIISDNESTIGEVKITEYTQVNNPMVKSPVNASTSAKPYVEVNSVNVVNTINGMRPYSQNKGYNEFLILNVTVVNPQGSDYEFPLNEETLRIETENYRFDYNSNMNDIRLENPLKDYIREGETISGELLYEVRDGLDYMYVRLIPDGMNLGVYELQNIIYQPEYALITAPYVEVKSVKIVDTISGITPNDKNDGYDEFLVLDVTVENPEGSGFEFLVNEETLMIKTENGLSDYLYGANISQRNYVVKNPLNGFIHEGETLSGELVYEVRDDMVYKYVWLCPDGNPDVLNLGVYELQNIISQSAY